MLMLGYPRALGSGTFSSALHSDEEMGLIREPKTLYLKASAATIQNRKSAKCFWFYLMSLFTGYTSLDSNQMGQLKNLCT